MGKCIIQRGFFKRLCTKQRHRCIRAADEKKRWFWRPRKRGISSIHVITRHRRGIGSIRIIFEFKDSCGITILVYHFALKEAFWFYHLKGCLNRLFGLPITIWLLARWTLHQCELFSCVLYAASEVILCASWSIKVQLINWTIQVLLHVLGQALLKNSDSCCSFWLPQIKALI